MNLIHDPWIPVRRRGGSTARVVPWQVTEDLSTDPITAFASPRPDFDGTLAQLLVGLLQATLAPANKVKWGKLLREPPSPAELRTAFEPLADAFELVGDGPRFLQDLTLEEKESKILSIEKLLIDAGLHGGRDHFRKGGQVEAMCLPCAAAALATLQLQAPVGGRGHRASPRGGGPVTTLVRRATDIWSTLWANVLDEDALIQVAPDKNRPEDKFPWLAPTRLSDKPEKTTTAADVHPLQIYWPMPRRIRLQPEPVDPAVVCDLCGHSSETVVRSYWTRHHGVNYSAVWEHPFTPQRKSKDGTPLPLQMDSTGLSYRHWLGLVQNDPDRDRRPAPVVEALHQRLPGAGRRAEWRLWAFGYDMDNMKVRGWHEGMMQLLVPDPDLRADFEAGCLCLVRAARWAEWATQAACRQAMGDREKAGKTGKLTVVEARFWQATEADFYRLVGDVHGALSGPEPDTAIDALKRRWHRTLLREAGIIFEDWSGSGMFDAVDPARVARAWNRLQANLWGDGMKKALDLAELKVKEPVAAAGG